tara:strand:- start:360 stop:791 length:432 start_codon:yes stop_codon:yes gene_type:complete
MTRNVENKKNKKGQLTGFSLLELLVVLAIIGIILSFIVPNVINRPNDARKAKIINDIKVIETALDLYKLDNGKYPNEKNGLAVLTDSEKKYINGVPNDPWGIKYRYRNPGKFSSIDIWTFGADNIEGGENENADIGNWSAKDF